MTRSAFYHTRTLALYGFGVAWALDHLRFIFPGGFASNNLTQTFVFYALPLCFVTGLALTFFDHIFASLGQIWRSMEDGILAVVTPTAIAVLVPSLYLELWHGSLFEESQLFVALRLISYMALYTAMVLGVTACLGRVTGRLLFRS